MDIISIEALQDKLRSYSNLSGATVTYRTEAERLFTPQCVVIAGMITIHGAVQFWETSIDLSELKTRLDVDRLIESLHTSFDKAAVMTA